MTAATEVVLRLWPMPSSCGEARRAVRSFCSDNDLDVLTDDAVLLTSELVANAVQHAAGMVTMLALMVDDALVVAVRDDCDDLPTMVGQETFAERGRGLLVLSEIASDWGVNRQRLGKTVWFRLS